MQRQETPERQRQQERGKNDRWHPACEIQRDGGWGGNTHTQRWHSGSGGVTCATSFKTETSRWQQSAASIMEGWKRFSGRRGLINPQCSQAGLTRKQKTAQRVEKKWKLTVKEPCEKWSTSNSIRKQGCCIEVLYKDEICARCMDCGWVSFKNTLICHWFGEFTTCDNWLLARRWFTGIHLLGMWQCRWIGSQHFSWC